MHMVNKKQEALLSPQDLQSTCHDVSDPGIAWRPAAGWKSKPNKDQLSTWDIVDQVLKYMGYSTWDTVKPGQPPSFINYIIQLSGFIEV